MSATLSSRGFSMSLRAMTSLMNPIDSRNHLLTLAFTTRGSRASLTRRGSRVYGLRAQGCLRLHMV